MKGPLKRKSIDSEALALQVYLLDHFLIITKQKFTDDGEQVKLYRKVSTHSYWHKWQAELTSPFWVGGSGFSRFLLDCSPSHYPTKPSVLV